jgi:hypothetical protein
MAIEPFLQVMGKRVETWALHFVVAVAGWTAYILPTGIHNGEPIWQMGKGFVIYFTGIMILLGESAIQVLTTSRVPPNAVVLRKHQVAVLCISSFGVGASLMYIFAGISHAMLSIPFFAAGDGSNALGVSLVLVTIVCSVLVRILLRVGFEIVHLLSRSHGA